MGGDLDLDCACVILAFAAVAVLRASASVPRLSRLPSEPERVTALPGQLCRAGLGALLPLVRVATQLGVSANTITACSLAAGVGAGLLIAFGHFGVAGVLFVAASCGDALDGLVARATRTESVGGALFDASVDRYEEFFAFGGLAIFFRSNGTLLAMTLAALAASFMVSYGSAQAEARHVAVPAGLMRRPERAACLGVGIVLSPIASALSPGDGPSWIRDLPLIVAIAVIAVVGNVSAVQRLRTVASAVTGETRRSGGLPYASRPNGSLERLVRR